MPGATPLMKTFSQILREKETWDVPIKLKNVPEIKLKPDIVDVAPPDVNQKPKTTIGHRIRRFVFK